MKTRIDDAIARFMMAFVETSELDIGNLQALMDDTREQFGLDVVYLLEKIRADNLFAYKCVSFSKPEYDIRGVHLKIPDEEYDAALHMYDNDLVCGYNLDSLSDMDGVSNCIIHYGFVRKKLGSYDGSIGFQSFSPHIWSEEEKEALRKLGGAYKLILSKSLAEGVNHHLYERLSLEQKQYREALVKGSEFSFSFDITDGLIRERIMTAHGLDLVASVGIALPVRYDDFCAAYLETHSIQLLDETAEECFTRVGLLRRFAEGDTNLEWEYSDPFRNTCLRATVFMYQDQENEHVYGLFMAADITSARMRELEQRQALQAAYDAAHQASAAKTKFLAHMSHDIRTPMNGIIGMTAIAGAHLDDRSRVMDCLSKITAASHHLLGLINEVLDMSKIESGKIVLQEEAFSLSTFLDSLFAIIKPQLEAKRHELIISLNGIEHEKVIGDSQRIQQVFMNLMSNAVKYTPEGGRIRLCITEKPPVHAGMACYEFIFEDNGIGMSETFQQHLFEPFTRADDERVGKIQGTGLGMAITQNIVQMMNGSIQVESRLNQGTKFTVTLFLRLQDVDEAVSYEKFIDLPILVADDDIISCESTCLILSELGMRGEYVQSGQEAVERAAARHRQDDDYFAVILDWKMPGMDGLETTKEIRRLVGDSVPVIILSAYDWPDIEQEARAAGVNAFISKPLFKSRLAHMFHEILGRDPEETSEPALAAFQQEDFQGKRALLAEDNALNAEIAMEILCMAGLAVECAKDGREALDKVANGEDGRYDIIFMDIQMPGMDGYEAARAIRALPRAYAKNVPIVAMTANAFAEDALAARKAGMNEHIAKPIDFQQLLKTLNHWLEPPAPENRI